MTGEPDEIEVGEVSWENRDAVLSSSLPTPARLVLLTIAVFVQMHDRTPSVDELAASTGLSERSVRKHLRIARSEGFDHKVDVQFALDDPWALLRAQVFATKGCACHYCGKPASHVDHVVPKSKGGADALDNLVPACARCNLTKARRTVTEWRQ